MSVRSISIPGTLEGLVAKMTNRLRPESIQCVVIAEEGHGKLGTNLSDSLVAFMLPQP
jgi:hypothetical protein